MVFPRNRQHVGLIELAFLVLLLIAVSINKNSNNNNNNHSNNNGIFLIKTITCDAFMVQRWNNNNNNINNHHHPFQKTHWKKTEPFSSQKGCVREKQCILWSSSPSETETDNNRSTNNDNGSTSRGERNNNNDRQSQPRTNTRSYSTTNGRVQNTSSSKTDGLNKKTYNSNNSNGRSDSNNRNPNKRSYSGANTSSNRINGEGGGGGGSGGGGPSLRLENPKKLERLVNEMPGSSSELFDTVESSQQPQRRQQGGPGGGGQQQQRQPRRPIASTDGRQQQDGNSLSDIPTKGGDELGRPRRKIGGGPDATIPKRRSGDDDAARAKRKTSLRVDKSGRTGRSAEMVQRRGSLKKRDRSTVKAMKAEAAVERKTVRLPEGESLMLSELAELIDEKPVAVIKMLMSDLGVMASMTQSLDYATCIAVCTGFGKIVAGADDLDDELLELENSAISTGVVNNDDDPADLVTRAPVVTIMGHVDHGKTSLLDAIRSTDVTATEAGGITQHIAAYQVKHNGQDITFIDTPGHAAFTDMRERGANITDIVILVVAADDGVKQQTADSIVCARQAGVPMIVAINKIDKETADPVRVMTELTNYDILTEDFGGDVLVSQISAKQKTNLNDLLDKIMLQAEIQDLKANPNRDADCIVIEANVEKGLGTVATTLVKRGTLRIGDIFVAGETYGRVRALLPTTGNNRLKEAGPSMPVRVVGFEGVPAAGDILVVAKDEQTARDLAESRKRIAREQSSSSYQAGLMSSMSMAFGAKKQQREMCVVVKADVQGSAEALTRALRELKLENDEAVVTVKVLVSETGEVSKSDIAIASVTPDTTVIAFNVAASQQAMQDARAIGLSIEYYNIIYDAIESVESRMQEVLSPTPDGEYVGSVIVQAVFNIGGTGNIAGSRCRDGVIKKGGTVRVMRGDKILIETKIKSLRNFKAETDTIEEGNECGIGLVDFEDFEVDDIIECYVE